jgi:hypothetical protein
MSLTAVAAASKILADTLSISKTVREQAKGSKDTDLKAHISDLYDSVLSLKEAVMLVADENNALRQRITELEHPPQKPTIRQEGDVNYYYVGDEGPYCQPCFDGKGGMLVRLTPVQQWSGGVRRKCEVCNKFFYERPMTDLPTSRFIR